MVRKLLCLALALGVLLPPTQAVAQGASAGNAPQPASDTIGAPITFDGLNDAASVPLAGQRAAAFNLAAGTLAATLTPEVSLDGEATWVATVFADPSSGATQPTLVVTNPNAATSLLVVYPGAASHARVRVSAFTSGSASASLRATATGPISMVYGYSVDTGALHPLPMKDSTPAGNEMAPIVRTIGAGGGSGGADQGDNTVFTFGTSPVNPAGFVYSTSPTAPTDGRVGAARMNVNRDAHALLTHPDGTPAVENTTGVKTTVTTVVSTYGANRRNSGTLGSLNAVVAVDTQGVGSLMWEVDTGTLSGTVVSECTLDNSNWFAVNMVELDGTYRSSLTSFGKRGWFREVNAQQCRLRVSAYTSGTSNARLEASIAPSGIHPQKVVCSKSVAINTSTTNGVTLVSAVTGQKIYVCGYDFMAGGTTNVKLIYGTTSTCATGSTDLTGPYPLTAQAGKVSVNGDTALHRTPASQGLCIHLSAAQQVSGFLHYEQF